MCSAPVLPWAMAFVCIPFLHLLYKHHFALQSCTYLCDGGFSEDLTFS